MDQLAATFIVRLAPTDSGAWTAVVERVKTGEKYRVGDLAGIGALIARIASGQEADPGAADAKD
ncbi:MAG: hypothetical protein ACRET8_10115 [Burkholderiales bacterium]